jgi:hypothetical protein
LEKGSHAGLVGTQNIRNTYSRIGGLDYIVNNGGVITDAIGRQVWSGEAKVHVSIVNWIKDGAPPATARLAIQRGDSVTSPWDTYELGTINSALSPGLDVSRARALTANEKPQSCFNGQMIGHKAFLISREQRAEMARRDPSTLKVTFPYLNGITALTGADLDRCVIDFEQRDRFEAEKYNEAFAWVTAHVLPDRERKAQEGKDSEGNLRPHHKAFLSRWWQLSFGRPELISRISAIPRYIACSLVTKRAIFVFVSSEIRPSNLLQVFAFADDYSFGVLQSGIHWDWFKNKSSKLKGDYGFGEGVWNTFPWPQKPTREQIKAVAEAAVALRALRRETMRKLKYSLRGLYRTLDQPGDNPLRDAHARLDAVVRAAYGMTEDADPLAFLLECNLACAAKEKAGEKITPPGLPLPAKEHGAFVTEDCIEPPKI